MDLKFQVQIKIQKPVQEVYDAVHNPEKLSGYFTNGGASAPLNEGTTVQWGFADNPGEAPISFPVTVLKAIPNELIELEWHFIRVASDGRRIHDDVITLGVEVAQGNIR